MKRIILSILLVSSCGIFEPTSDWIGWSSYYSGKWNIVSEMIKVSEVENSTSERISYTLVDSLEVINEESWNFISLSDYKIMNDLDGGDLYIGVCENDSTLIKPLPNNNDTLSLDSLFADCPDLLSPSPNECTKITDANSVLFFAPDSNDWLLVATNSFNNNASESIYFPYSIQGLRNLESYPENIFSFELFTPDINVPNPFINDCAISNKFTRISSDSSLVTIERRCKYRTEHIDSQRYTDYNNELEIYYKWRQNCVRTFSSFWNFPEYNDENFNCNEYPTYPCEYLSPPLYPKYRFIKHNIIIKKESE